MYVLSQIKHTVVCINNALRFINELINTVHRNCIFKLF